MKVFFAFAGVLMASIALGSAANYGTDFGIRPVVSENRFPIPSVVIGVRGEVKCTQCYYSGTGVNAGLYRTCRIYRSDGGIDQYMETCRR